MSRWGREPARRVDVVRPGHFLLRLVKHGPKVGARIRHEHGLWSATVDGTEYPADADPDRAQQVARIWTGGEVCSEREYGYRLGLGVWARAFMPSHPAAHPETPIDITRVPSRY